MGRSEQANTFVVDRDLNVLSMVGWVPRVTFFLSDKDPIIIKNIYEFVLHSFKSKAVLGLFTSICPTSSNVSLAPIFGVPQRMTSNRQMQTTTMLDKTS